MKPGLSHGSRSALSLMLGVLLIAGGLDAERVGHTGAAFGMILIGMVLIGLREVGKSF